MVHIEFILPGPPVSYQTSDKVNLRTWQATVRTEAGKVWLRPPLTGKVKCVILNMHEGDKPTLDDDNMVKPIRDAMNNLVYDDDRQIRYSETIHIPLDSPVKIRGTSAILLAGYARNRPFLYVRIEDMPTVLHLPGA